MLARAAARGPAASCPSRSARRSARPSVAGRRAAASTTSKPSTSGHEQVEEHHRRPLARTSRTPSSPPVARSHGPALRARASPRTSSRASGSSSIDDHARRRSPWPAAQLRRSAPSSSSRATGFTRYSAAPSAKPGRARRASTRSRPGCAAVAGSALSSREQLPPVQPGQADVEDDARRAAGARTSVEALARRRARSTTAQPGGARGSSVEQVGRAAGRPRSTSTAGRGRVVVDVAGAGPAGRRRRGSADAGWRSRRCCPRPARSRPTCRPPCSSTIRCDRVSPRPVPSRLRRPTRAPCWKASKMRSCSLRAMPMPVSRDRDAATSPPAGARSPSTAPPSGGELDRVA